MILTVTMNVAIDKAYVLGRANTPGEVLRVAECRATPGGKGLNVAKAATALGEEVIATGIVGGYAGDWIVENLHQRGVVCDFERAEGESRTCINIIEPDGRQTEYLEPGPTVDADTAAGFMKRFMRLASEADVITLSGSLPRGLPEDYYAGLIDYCRRIGKPVLLDTSGRLLMEGIKAGPSMIKPNLDELGQLLGRPAGTSVEDIAAAARALNGAGVPLVVASMGKRGAVAATDKGAFYALPPSIEAVNATGSGDCMTAGFAVGLLRGWPVDEALRYATATAAANALELETGRVNPDNVRRLYDQVRVESVD